MSIATDKAVRELQARVKALEEKIAALERQAADRANKRQGR